MTQKRQSATASRATWRDTCPGPPPGSPSRRIQQPHPKRSPHPKRGWGGPAPADDGKTKFWNKKADRRPRKGEQVGGSATGHIAKDGDAWGTKKQYYKDDDGNWQSYDREGPMSELF